MRPNDYPLPDYTAYIWFSGDGLSISFPPTGPESKGSTITIPLSRLGLERGMTGELLPSQRGWAVLLQSLKDRSMNRFRSLGQRGTPSAYEVERALANDQRYTAILGAMNEAKSATKAEITESEDFLKELGI